MTARVRKKAILARRFTGAVEAAFSRRFDCLTSDDDHIPTTEELLRRAGSLDADILVVTATERLAADAIAELPDSVRVIATLSVGFDHIDLDAARARGIAVLHTPDVLSDACAEMALLLLLAAARRGHEGNALVRGGGWRGWAPTQLLGKQLTRKRLGIFGMGRIGRAFARNARGMEMEIHYCNRRRLPRELEEGAVFHQDPDELLEVSEFFSLNCPANEETIGFLNRDRIERLPRGAVVVNIARGDLVDDEALIAALQSGRIAAAGLDVFDNEPDIHPAYRTLPNVFLTPHLGSATEETRDRMGFMLLEGIERILAGDRADNQIV